MRNRVKTNLLRFASWLSYVLRSTRYITSRPAEDSGVFYLEVGGGGRGIRCLGIGFPSGHGYGSAGYSCTVSVCVFIATATAASVQGGQCSQGH